MNSEAMLQSQVPVVECGPNRQLRHCRFHSLLAPLCTEMPTKLADIVEFSLQWFRPTTQNTDNNSSLLPLSSIRNSVGAHLLCSQCFHIFTNEVLCSRMQSANQRISTSAVSASAEQFQLAKQIRRWQRTQKQAKRKFVHSCTRPSCGNGFESKSICTADILTNSLLTPYLTVVVNIKFLKFIVVPMYI